MAWVIDKDTWCIEGLDEMVAFHNIKQYHMCIVEYMGGGKFKLEVINPYCVQINYTVNNNVQLSFPTNSSVVGNDEFLRDLEVGKLFETFRYNAYYSCDAICEFLVDEYHLTGASYTKVYSKN